MIFALIALLTVNSPVLVEQANFDVSLVEVDAAFYEMPNNVRNKVAYEPSDLEKVMLNHLKYEFVYDYIVKNKLLTKEIISKEIQLAVAVSTDRNDEEFVKKYNYDKDYFLNEYLLFLKKKYNYDLISSPQVMLNS